MATTTAPPQVRTQSPGHPPERIGLCVYCQQPLYAESPVSELDEPLSHVGCAVDARRRGERI